MCGICGIIDLSHQPVAEQDIKKMMMAIKHRGPDDEGIFMEKSLGLGFIRLSILDLSNAGHQPMFSDDGNLVLIFNGEIFNYIEIRNELKEKGHTFKTGTDSEVLLKAYLEWSEQCLHKFNGMWSFVIYDRKNQTIFASRDRYGIKPFYYCFDGSLFLFASEIPAIFQILKSKPKANQQAIFDFLVFNRTDQDESTFFQNIKKLKHGHNIKINLKPGTGENSMVIEKWYDLKSNLKGSFGSPGEYLKTFESAVSLRMRSDVPVGVCLSGGLDSSGIVSVLLNSDKDKELQTFSAVYNPKQAGDESEYIKEYDPLLKNMHYTTPTAEEFYNDIHDFVKLHAEPVSSTSVYAQFRLMKLAKGKVSVILDGQGADEQLAGYHYFFGIFFKDLFTRFCFGRLFKEIKAYSSKHHSWFGLKTFMFFLFPKKIRTRVRIKEKAYLTKKFAKLYRNTSTISAKLYGSRNLNDSLLDHFEYKLEHHLKWDDLNSMHFSIESRAPFLDHRLVERSLSLPSEFLINNGSTKFILRESMKGILPEKIRKRQDKVGFHTPEGEWFREDYFRSFISDILNSESFQSRGIIDSGKAKKLYALHVAGKNNISRDIWKWIHLELWFRKFID